MREGKLPDNYFNPQPKNKYSAKKQTYNGRAYDSMLEANKAIDLDWLVKAGEVKSWTAQHKFDLRINSVHITNYYIDFRVINSNGTIDYIEIKGFPTDLWRIKFLMTKALFDELTPGENARLYLNEKCVLQSMKNKNS